MYEDQGKKNTGFQIWMPFAIAIALSLGLLVGLNLSKSSPVVQGPILSNNTGQGNGKVEELIRYIEAKYVDEVDRDELTNQAIHKILENLDPHSAYIPAEELADVNEQLNGKFDGIGVEFLLVEDTIVIISILENGPSEKVGLKPGDRIVAIEDSTIVGPDFDSEKVMARLRGRKGTDVEITVYRKKTDATFNVSITRGHIPIKSVDAAFWVDEDIAYIKINRFSSTTYKEFVEAIDRLSEKEKQVNLIIDLRNNHGGYLQQATNILSQIFNDSEKLLVYTEGNSVRRSEYETTGRNYYDIRNLTVLIDEGSASASEILAGAIQDYDRGVIIGRRSYGKGLVQEQYNLKDGAALRLTVARYYIPSGRSIQRPYKEESYDNYQNEIYDRYHNGEVYEEKNSPDDELEQAYFTKNGRKVYGNGGISPDVFVPFDSILFDDNLLELQGYIPLFALEYFEENELKTYQSIEDFDLRFKIDEELFSSYLSFAKAKGLEIKEPFSENVTSKTKEYLKARIAKHYFNDEGYYAILNKKDKMVLKALEVLSLNNPLSLLTPDDQAEE